MTNARITEIDLLRFIAALSVVFFHYTFRGYAADSMSIIPYPLIGPYSKYGYLGVNLFFMISGFVILMTASSGSLKRFFVSRFVRLYPAFWASCTITFITILLIGEPRYTATLSQYLINMTMLNEFLGVPSIDGVYWSLLVEIQFYALMGIVLLFKKIAYIEIYLIFWIILSVVLQFFSIKLLNFLLIVDYSAYFIAGATFYLVWQNGLSRSKVAILILSLALSIYQSIHSLVYFEQKYNTTMNIFGVGAIITCFFIVMLLVSLKRTGFVGNKEWALAGALTYPIYLLHQNIGFMIFNISYRLMNPYVLLCITLVIIFFMAYMVNIFIEKRFSSHLKSLVNKTVDMLFHLKIK